MNKFQVAAEALERQAIKYKGLVDAADALKEIGSLEQAAEEAKAQAAKAQAELIKLQQKLVAVRGEHADTLRANDIAIQLQQDGAKEAVAKIIRGAEEEAADVVRNAQDKAAKMVAQAATEKARLQGELTNLQLDLKDAADELEQIREQKASAEKAAADAQKKLDEIKAKFATL